MNPALLVIFGWLVPGGSYLLLRRYAQFAMFALVVTTALIAGIALGGGCQWPQAAELSGLDTFTGIAFQAGAAIKILAGLPYLAAQAFGCSGSLIAGRLHEYGSTLLILAGVFNVLAISSAFDCRK